MLHFLPLLIRSGFKFATGLSRAKIRDLFDNFIVEQVDEFNIAQE